VEVLAWNSFGSCSMLYCCIHRVMCQFFSDDRCINASYVMCMSDFLDAAVALLAFCTSISSMGLAYCALSLMQLVPIALRMFSSVVLSLDVLQQHGRSILSVYIKRRCLKAVSLGQKWQYR